MKQQILNFFRRFLRKPFFERILIKNIQSNSILSNICIKLTPGNHLYPKKTFRNINKNGVFFNVDISDYIGHYLYFGFKDLGIQELFRISKDQNVIFDVGANIGFTCLTMSNPSSTKAKVYAFEPDEFNYNQLISNCKLNEGFNIIPENIGLGETERSAKLVINSPDNLGGNRISNDATEDFSTIKITTIDLYCTEKNINHLDLIKIDVEGYEFNVLKGAIKTIETFKPILFIEVDDENLKLQDSSAKILIEFLEVYYSKIYDASTKIQLNSSDNFNNCHIDIVATN